MNNPINSATWRHELAISLREKGLRFKDIGEIFGVSTTRASQIFRQAEMRKKYKKLQEENPSKYPDLSTRASNALKNYGGVTTREEIIALVEAGIDLKSIPNLGKRTEKEILDYVKNQKSI